MSACGKPGCVGCSVNSDDSYREFFQLWENLVTPDEERDMTISAQKATGISYFDVMVDKPRNP